MVLILSVFKLKPKTIMSFFTTFFSFRNIYILVTFVMDLQTKLSSLLKVCYIFYDIIPYNGYHLIGNM